MILVISLLIWSPDAAEQWIGALQPNITVWIFNSRGPSWTAASVPNTSTSEGLNEVDFWWRTLETGRSSVLFIHIETYTYKIIVFFSWDSVIFFFLWKQEQQREACESQLSELIRREQDSGCDDTMMHSCYWLFGFWNDVLCVFISHNLEEKETLGHHGSRSYPDHGW